MTFMEGTNIEHTKGDTFKLELSPFENEAFEQGSTLQFVIAKNEKQTAVINKSVALSGDIFIVEISSEEIGCLEIGNYIYKTIIHYPDGSVITQNSGDFIVNWGV